MASESIVLADSPGASVQLCGVSTLERLLRTLQRCGIKSVTILTSTPDAIETELARPSWARAQLELSIRTRPVGPVTMEQIVDVWPGNSARTQLVLVVPADSVFDPRLLRPLISQANPTVLVDSGVRRQQLQTLIASAPDTVVGKLCGPAVLSYEWTAAQDGFFEHALRDRLESDGLDAVDVSHQPLYYVSMRRKLRPYWFPAPSAANR